jgi:hypothetical protein
MSLRPITVSEEVYAKGHPWVNIFSTFGALQGVLIYLNRRRIPFQSNWFAQQASLPIFAVLVLGGYVAGGSVAMAAFTDWSLLRIAMQHKQDKAMMTDSQNINTFSVAAT